MINPIRQLTRLPERADPYIAKPCALSGCGNKTRESKPYCPEHVEHHPYVSELVARLTTRERELQRVARRGARAVDLDGLMAEEIMLQLELYGSRTAERLCRDLQQELPVIQAYFQALARHGYVVLGETSRGNCLATPVPRHARAQARQDRRRLRRA